MFTKANIPETYIWCHIENTYEIYFNSVTNKTDTYLQNSQIFLGHTIYESYFVLIMYQKSKKKLRKSISEVSHFWELVW